jgi:hypothetical protein
VLADGAYAAESRYTSTTTVRLEVVKAAAKLPLRSMLSPCFGVILRLLMFVSLCQRLFWEVSFLWVPSLTQHWLT